MSRKNRATQVVASVNADEAVLKKLEQVVEADAAEPSAPHVETVEEFLARGGEVEVLTNAAASEPKVKGKRGKRELNLDDPYLKQTIKLNRQENPKRKGSKSAKRFDLYRDGMTALEFIQAGGTRGDLNWDSQHEHITLVPAPKS